MRIDIYSAPELETRLESIDWAGTFEQYLDATIPTWRDMEVQRFAAYLDGVKWPQDRWGETLAPGAVVRVNTIPMGGLFKIIDPILSKLLNVFRGKRPVTNRETPESRNLEAADGKANTAKLGSVVAEPAGRYRRYVDYLTPPRRYFVNKREQWLVFLANVGPGYYQIADADVRVGSTPFSALGDDAAYGIYPPGTNLSGQVAAQIWHTVTEVGGTSSGSAGLELTTDLANRDNTDPASYSLSGATITRSGGEYPSGWGVSTVVAIEYVRPYDIVDHAVDPTEFDPGYVISRFRGYFGHMPSVAVGDVFQVGAFGSNVEWRVKTIVASPGSGIYTLEFEEDAETFTPIRVAPGSGVSYIFGSDVARTITGFDPVSITVSPGVFETGSASVRLRFAGGSVYGEWTNEFIATPDGAVTSTLELDVFFPNGLCFLSDGGDVESRSVSVEYQYRNVAGGPRVTVARTFSDATVDQIGFTEQFAIAPMVPAVRMRRVGAQSTSTQAQDKCQWYGLKARMPDYWVYPDWTTISVMLRSGGKLAAQSENQINVIPVRVLPTLLPDGTWSSPTPTRDITAFARYILQSAGVGDEAIDIEEWLRLDAIWKARGDTLDFVFDATTVKEALDTTFGAGMAEFTCGDGLVRPVREDVKPANEEFQQSYGPFNMKGPLRRNRSTHSEITDYDGVDVEYVNAETWVRETVQCRLPGDLGAKVQKITLDGVTDRTRAWRIGMRRRAALYYRKSDYSFNTELDALNSEYMGYVGLFGYGRTGLLVGIESDGAGGAILESSEPITWNSSEGPHVVAYRRLDGSFAGPFTASEGVDEYHIRATVPEPWPSISLSHEPPHLYFGPLSSFCFPALISGVLPRGDFEVAVTAVNYDQRVYSFDNAFPPA